MAAEELADLELINQQLPPPSSHEKVARQRAKLCLKLACAFERHQEWQSAFELHALHDLPPARERRVRMLEKLGLYAQAWTELSLLLENPISEQERQAALRMAPRIAKKADKIFKKHTALPLPEIHLDRSCLCPSLLNESCIEQVVAHHLHTPQEPCFYVENSLFNGLLGLWLWPEMFRSVAGAFAHPFQLAPLDLYDTAFIGRRPGMESLWDQLESDGHGPAMTATWHARFGIANALVNWQCLNEELLNLALSCIPGAHLKLIFNRQLFDLRDNRSGFPDLIQFYPGRCAYRLIEIKASGDRVQDNQRRWLDYFARHDIPASVCHVN